MMSNSKGFKGVNVRGGRFVARPLSERFWEKVDRSGGPDACWPWTASLNRPKHADGYPQIALDNDGPKILATYASWLLHHGELPPKAKRVCHACDNRKCVNPAHLFLGTQSDNIKDAVAKGRHDPMPGTRHPRHKLDDEKVRELRRLAEEGTFTLKALAAKFGIAPPTAKRIIERKSWKHVT